ncbi:drug:proton antiporter [Aureimonas ureilytica]|uniref:Drug:proton antiporter n=1 Tax=Aureimonas ureilytica TaxID=401562 RepID=A0A175R514_9HYPH|nr:VOC family protein [Aureimonas ureilytica]KTQ84619.1 drug:proton antiporter [Aureimonas ureilytica]
MLTASNILLYVTDPARSAAFYQSILGRAPVEQSPGFALLPLSEGMMIGLWKREGVQPTPDVAPGGCEIGFKLADDAAVDAAHAEWQAKGARIALAPVDLEFGRSFVALDPDGHRLRVYALHEEM